MGRSERKIEEQKAMYEGYKDVFEKFILVCNDIINGQPESCACRNHGINWHNFRRILRTPFMFNNINIDVDVDTLSKQLYCNKFATWKDEFMHDLTGTDNYWIRDDFDDLYERITKEALNDRQIQILNLYYQMDETLETIGEHLCITKTRVSQLLNKAISRLRNPRWINIFLFGDEYSKYEDLNQKILELEEELNKMYINNIDKAKDIEKAINAIKEGLFEEVIVEDNILNKPIYELNISVRSYNCLIGSKIKTVGELCELTYTDLCKIRNLGRKSLNEILDALSVLGLSIKEED